MEQRNKMNFLNKIKNVKKYLPAKVILIVILVLLFSVIFLKFFVYLSIPKVDDLFNKGKTTKLYPSKYISQKIIAEEDNLGQIYVAFRGVDYHPKDEFTLEITDEFCQSPVRKVEANFFLRWPSYTPIKFPRIENSAGKTYCVKFMFNPQSKRKRDLPRIYVSTGTEAEGYQYINEGEGRNSDLGVAVYKNERLMIKPAYDHGFLGNIKSLIERMSQYKPWFLKGHYLFVLIFLTIVLTFVVCVGIILL